MFHYIMTSAGYVESSKMSTIIWASDIDEPWMAEDPIHILKSLADNLFYKFLSEELTFPWEERMNFSSCHKYKTAYETNACDVCGALLRPLIDSGDILLDFQDWLVGLHSVEANDFGDDLKDWWPWQNWQDLLTADKNQIILVPEQFDVLIASICDTPSLYPEERKLLSDYREEEFVHDTPSVRINSDGFTEIELYFDSIVSFKENE